MRLSKARAVHSKRLMAKAPLSREEENSSEARRFDGARYRDLAVLESLDVGKPISNALGGDIPNAIRTLRYYAEALDKIYGEVAPEAPDRFSFVLHEPLGVIGAIVPWNFPLHMAMWKVAPALAMGNSVVLKPAEQSPLTALKLGELALEAGLPAGALNVVPGFGAEAGKALALHNDVDMIAFTGSGGGRQAADAVFRAEQSEASEP